MKGDLMKPTHAAIVAFVVAAGAAMVSALAAGVSIGLPTETAALKPGPGVELVASNCQICHSADYITTQPRDKPLAFWKAEVEKMKKAYGAPIADDQIDAAAAYLARSYGSGN
jgi:mono/diheme cytochrome c family protein